MRLQHASCFMGITVMISLSVVRFNIDPSMGGWDEALLSRYVRLI